ncbi:hypothetical protein OESDEN_23030 [Oesophagostomum dentatum]|uniref:Uncharacterized protein n=1 Tax=Oesophagostomum dentatum TaxID=61180 RepID=A0A0B1S297_OESDE|nr:hypothetical protein OESDEN_23030 [Oesophagostomum dentatum]
MVHEIRHCEVPRCSADWTEIIQRSRVRRVYDGMDEASAERGQRSCQGKHPSSCSKPVFTYVMSKSKC